MPRPLDVAVAVYISHLRSVCYLRCPSSHHLPHTQVDIAHSAMWHPPQDREPYHPPPKSRKRTSAPSVIASSRLKALKTTRIFENYTSQGVSSLIVPTEPLEMKKGGKIRQLLHGGRECTPTRRRRRIALTMRSVPFVWRSLRLGCQWRGWSVFVDFIGLVSRHGSSIIQVDVQFISMTGLGTSEHLSKITGWLNIHGCVV